LRISSESLCTLPKVFPRKGKELAKLQIHLTAETNPEEAQYRKTAPGRLVDLRRHCADPRTGLAGTGTGTEPHRTRSTPDISEVGYGRWAGPPGSNAACPNSNSLVRLHPPLSNPILRADGQQTWAAQTQVVTLAFILRRASLLRRSPVGPAPRCPHARMRLSPDSPTMPARI
jgi:hypothetical protein